MNQAHYPLSVTGGQERVYWLRSLGHLPHKYQRN